VERLGEGRKKGVSAIARDERVKRVKKTKKKGTLASPSSSSTLMNASFVMRCCMDWMDSRICRSFLSLPLSGLDPSATCVVGLPVDAVPWNSCSLDDSDATYSTFNGLFPADHGSNWIASQSAAALRGLTRPTFRAVGRFNAWGR